MGEAGGMWEISVPSSQLCSQPKRALKISLSKTNTYMKFVFLKNVLAFIPMMERWFTTRKI